MLGIRRRAVIVLDVRRKVRALRHHLPVRPNRNLRQAVAEILDRQAFLFLGIHGDLFRFVRAYGRVAIHAEPFVAERLCNARDIGCIIEIRIDRIRQQIGVDQLPVRCVHRQKIFVFKVRDAQHRVPVSGGIRQNNDLRLFERFVGQLLIRLAEDLFGQLRRLLQSKRLLRAVRLGPLPGVLLIDDRIRADRDPVIAALLDGFRDPRDRTRRHFDRRFCRLRQIVLFVCRALLGVRHGFKHRAAHRKTDRAADHQPRQHAEAQHDRKRDEQDLMLSEKGFHIVPSLRCQYNAKVVTKSSQSCIRVVKSFSRAGPSHMPNLTVAVVPLPSSEVNRSDARCSAAISWQSGTPSPLRTLGFLVCEGSLT